jgi:hypothetical protein
MDCLTRFTWAAWCGGKTQDTLSPAGRTADDSLEQHQGWGSEIVTRELALASAVTGVNRQPVNICS